MISSTTSLLLLPVFFLPCIMSSSGAPIKGTVYNVQCLVCIVQWIQYNSVLQSTVHTVQECTTVKSVQCIQCTQCKSIVQCRVSTVQNCPIVPGGSKPGVISPQLSWPSSLPPLPSPYSHHLLLLSPLLPLMLSSKLINILSSSSFLSLLSCSLPNHPLFLPVFFLNLLSSSSLLSLLLYSSIPLFFISFSLLPLPLLLSFPALHLILATS